MKGWWTVGDSTGIEWCDATFNPWWGCWPVSTGCALCYAGSLAERYGWKAGGAAGPDLWENKGPRRTFGDAHWSGKNSPLAWANTLPAKLGRRPRIFCASMADIGEDHPTADQERPKLWALIEATPELDWLLLTKRTATARQWLPARWLEPGAWPRNAWFGFSAEDQQRFDERWPAAAEIPAAIRFVSLEPLLGPIDLSAAFQPRIEWPATFAADGRAKINRKLSWIIAGGESGPKARPARPAWFRSARDQAAAAGVPFLFKQWGEYAYLEWTGWEPRTPNGYWPVGRSADHRFEGSGGAETCAIRVGKRAAGRLLDGRTWDEYPA